MNGFFAAWVTPFCAECLETTRLQHRADPRTDVDLLAGVFPGCCHAGAGDTFVLSDRRRPISLPEALRRALLEARAEVSRSLQPLRYRVRERGTGRTIEGVCCGYFGDQGCLLGDLKGPLCLLYLCPAIEEAFAAALGVGPAPGAGFDLLCGAAETLRKVAAGPPATAERRLAALERELGHLGARLRGAGVATGDRLHRAWLEGRTGAEKHTTRREGVEEGP